MLEDVARKLVEILGPLRAGRQPTRSTSLSGSKHRRDLRSAILASGLRSGGVVSFHHHYRNGDRLLNVALDTMADLGLRDLTLAASSIFPAHAPLLGHLKSGLIRNIVTSYVKGPVADAISAGALAEPIILQSHGGRARSICSGQFRIDLALIGASIANPQGAATGRLGRAACGPLGYAMVDAGHAREVVVVADLIAEIPDHLVDIPASQVDHLVEMSNVGDPAGILSGVTVPLATPLAKELGRQVAEVMRCAGLIQDGLSFQTGSGGFTLGSVPSIGQALSDANVRGDYISGGLTGAHVDLVKQGLMSRIRDVQSFDLAAVRSSTENSWHEAMSAEAYASPNHPSPAVNGLSATVLGAAEVDADFNVNVAIGGNGRIIGGPGGHPDTASGADLAIVVTALKGGGFPKLVKNVATCTTPGSVIGAVITDAGIAIHPSRPELQRTCNNAGLAIRKIEDLIYVSSHDYVRRGGSKLDDRIVAISENRMGHVQDVVTCCE